MLKFDFLIFRQGMISVYLSGECVMGRLATALALLLSAGSIAVGEVSATVYLADGNTPLEWADPNVPFVYPDIMVGAGLVIVISSDANEGWSGVLKITYPDTDYGFLSARDYNHVTLVWEGSILEAAGEGGGVKTSAGSLRAGFTLKARNPAAAGDWFILDYTAAKEGNCTVTLYEYLGEKGSDIDPFNPPPPEKRTVSELVFSHVPSRDFNADAKVDFVDFAIISSFRGLTNCADSNWCEGTDLDKDGDVDTYDLILFADYWLMGK